MDRRSLSEDRILDRESGVAAWQDLPEAMKLGDVCFQAERYGDALEAYGRALQETSRQALGTDLRARLHYRIAACHMARANYRLALEHLDLSRRSLPRHLDRATLAKIHALRGRILQEMGEYGRALRYLEWAEKLFRGTENHEDLAQTDNRLGGVLLRLGRTAEARDAFLNALATYRRIEHKSGEANTLNNLALLYKNACDFREAVRYLEMARTLCERIGYRQRLVTLHINLGIVYFKLSKWELCEEHLTTAGAMAQEAGSPLWQSKVLLARGNLALRRRHLDEAEGLYLQAHAMATRENYAREVLLAEEFRGELLVARGALDEASALLESVVERARALAPDGDIVYEALRRLAEVRFAQQRLDDAETLAHEAAAIAERTDDRYELALISRILAVIAVFRGAPDADATMERSLATLGDIGDSYQKGVTHLAYARGLAERAARHGSDPQLEQLAAAQFQRAYGVFLDLDARTLAAETAMERARLEFAAQRVEEAAAFRARAEDLLAPGSDSRLESELASLGARIDDAFAERWTTGGDLLSSLREVKDLLQGVSETGAVLRRLLQVAVTQTRSSRGCVALTAPSGKPHIVAAEGWSEADALAFARTLAPHFGEALRDNRPLWIPGPGRPAHGQAAAERPKDVEEFVLLPFALAQGEPGFLYVDKARGSDVRAFHQGDLQLLTILANFAALSEMERLNERLAQENEELRKRIAGDSASRFVTAHPGLLETLRLLRKVADSPVSVLLVGETGTGKGLLAQLLHDTSRRRDKPFVQINCAAIPEQLLESELFGHVKGAFTGATYNKVGLFQEADRGTVFLDEVDKTSYAVQAKLLHVLDSKEIRPVGAVKPIPVDSRVVCATNADLRAKIRAGEFLEDLYYRLNDFPVLVPPIRERREDIPLLLDHFLKRFAGQYERPGIKMTREVRRVLLDHDWPGNVRELEKVVRRLVVLSEEDQPVGLELLPPDLRSDLPAIEGTTLREELARTERRVLADALRTHGWNRSQVSRVLKISYPALLKKIKDYGLEEPAARR